MEDDYDLSAEMKPEVKPGKTSGDKREGLQSILKEEFIFSKIFVAIQAIYSGKKERDGSPLYTTTSKLQKNVGQQSLRTVRNQVE